MKNKRSRIPEVFALHAVLALLATFPLVFNLGSAMPYAFRPEPGAELACMAEGGFLEEYYELSLFGAFLRGGEAPFFADPLAPAAEGAGGVFTARGMPFSPLFCALSPLGGIAAYNLLIILSFVACGIGMFLLAGRYAESVGARFFASALFAFFPFRVALLFDGSRFGWLILLLPFYVYGCERWFEEKRARHFLLVSAAALLMAMGDLHIAYMSLLFTLLFSLFKGVKAFHGGELRVFPLAAAGVFMAWGFAAAYAAFVSNVVSGGVLWTPWPYEYPGPGDFINRSGVVPGRLVYPGLAALAAAVFGFFGKGEERYRQKKQALRLFGLTALAGAFLAVGPNLRGVPLYRAFRHLAPFSGYADSFAGFFSFSALSLCVLAAVGMEKLEGASGSRFKASLIASAIILSLLDFGAFERPGLSRLPSGNSVYEHVKRSGSAPVLLEAPFPGEYRGIYLYYNTIYRVPVVNGMFGVKGEEAESGVIRALLPLNYGLACRDSLARLSELGVSHLILRERAFIPGSFPFPFGLVLSNMKASPHFEFMGHEGGLYLFAFKGEDAACPGEARSLPWRTGVIYEAGGLHGRAGRMKFDEDASDGFARFESGGREEGDFLIFGPFENFPPGSYRAVFRLKGTAENNDRPFARLDVSGERGRRVFAARELSAEEAPGGVYTDFELEFELARVEEMEFRIKWFGNGEIYADYVYASFAGEKGPAYFFNAGELFYHGGPGCLNQPGPVMRGGSRRYEPGNYRAVFRLDALGSAEGTAAVLRVLHSGTGAAVAEKKLDRKRMDRENEFGLGFSVQNKTAFCFEVYSTGIADIRPEWVKITSEDIPDPVKALKPDESKSGVLRLEYETPGFIGLPRASRVPSPALGGRADNLYSSFVWKGFFEAEAGEHEIGVVSEGRAQVYIDGAIIIDTGLRHRPAYQGAKVELEEGFRLLKVRHTAPGNAGFFRIYWAEPSLDSPVPLPVRGSFFLYPRGRD